MPTVKHALWALLPCILLALSSVTLLAPARPAQAAPVPVVSASAHPATQAYDDGDGDELLEHWGDPKYSREERMQMAGMAALLVPVLLLARRGRTARKAAKQ